MSVKRDLGLLHATMMGLGSTICAGIFVILSPAVVIAGPAVILSFLICGVINIATMLSYCELGAAMPRLGGEYVYVKAAFKGLPGFLTGWYEWSSNIFYATLMVLGSAYILSYVTTINQYFIMAALVVTFTLINIKGVKTAGSIQTLLTLILLAIIALFIGAGLAYGSGPNAFEPFMPKGFLGVIAAIAFIFETYVGVEAIAATQAEIKKPEKTIPRAMILSSITLIIIYCLVAYVTIGIVSPDTKQILDPAKSGSRNHHGQHRHYTAHRGRTDCRANLAQLCNHRFFKSSLCYGTERTLPNMPEKGSRQLQNSISSTRPRLGLHNILLNSGQPRIRGVLDKLRIPDRLLLGEPSTHQA